MSDVERALRCADLVALAEARTSLVKHGTDFRGDCPFHAESQQSFSVDAARQVYHCAGCGAYGDAISFLRQLDALSLERACDELISPTNDLGERQPPGEWQSARPPAEAELTDFGAPGLGQPLEKFPYRDAGNATTGWALRYGDGTKLYLTWGAAPGHEPMWAFRNSTRPRPLYGLDRLASAPARQVLLLDDEAAADTGLLLGVTPMAWPAGARGVQQADFSPFDGLSVVLMARNDDEGRKAVKWLRQHLIGRRCGVKVIEPEPGRPPGWSLLDAAAEGWTPDQAKAWARARLDASIVPATQPKLPPPPPPPPAAPTTPPAPTPAQIARRQRAEEQAVRQQAIQQAEAAKLSEIDLSDIFVRRFGDNWRYVAEWDAWYEWVGDGWREDKTRKVREQCASMLRESGNWTESASLAAAGKRGICSNRTVSAVTTIAAADRRIAATADQWDTDPWLLGVPGGVIDLREGKLVEAMQEDHITRRCAIAPAPGEPALWMAHLERTQRGDQQVIGFLRRYFGYMLTGRVDAHALVYFYGTGRNGKGVMIGTLIKILGDYGYAAPVNIITESKTERHSVELAMLRGKRGVSFSEPPKGARWDDGRIRSLTGGDPITARMLNQNPQTFDPTHKLLGMGNHKPVLRSVDEAIKSRFNLVDFSLTIPEEDRISDFAQQLEAEWPQILHWMIQGCLEWQRVGLGRPGSVKEATAAYLEDEDVLATWIADCCEYKGSEPVATLYRSYSAWCERTGERAPSQRAFAGALYERPGIEKGRSSQARMVIGLQVTPTARPNATF